MNENGKATIISVFSKAASPPENSSTIAIDASKMPQMTFCGWTELDCRFLKALPHMLQNLPKLQNVLTKIMATMESMVPPE